MALEQVFVGKTADAARPMSFTSCRLMPTKHGATLLVEAEGVGTSDAAERLRGLNVYAAESDLPLAEGETISTVLPLPEDEEEWKNLHVVFATARGGVRRNSMDAFANVPSNGKFAMRFDEGADDRLIVEWNLVRHWDSWVQDPVTFQAVLSLNNDHAAELSWLEPERLSFLVGQAFYARRIGMVDAFLLAFDQIADYDSPNYLWFRGLYPRFIYIDRIAVATPARGRGHARRLYADLFDQAGFVGTCTAALLVDEVAAPYSGAG